MVTFTTASALGAFFPADSQDWVLNFPKTSNAQGYEIKTGLSGAISQYTLVYDVLMPAATMGGYVSFLQTNLNNSNDGDLFGKKSAAGYGIGISGNYQGAASLDAWHRVAFTISASTSAFGSSTITKYIDGVKVGTQSVGGGTRYLIEAGNERFFIMADEDNETSAGKLSSVFFANKVLSDSEIAALGGPKAEGVMAAAPSGYEATQFDFDNGQLTASFGKGAIARRGDTSDTITTAAAANLPELPASPADSGVLEISAPAKATDGFLFDPAIEGTVTTFTMVFDVMVKSGEFAGDWNALFQTNLANSDDAKFFMKKDGASFGIGKGDYHGAAALDVWHRIAVTLTPNGDGKSTMRKYIDGVEVGTGTYETAEYTVSDKGVLLFADNDGEGVPSHLNSFLFTDKAMSAAEIGALGGAKVGGVLTAAAAQGNVTQFDFDAGTLAASFGKGTIAVAPAITPETPAPGAQSVTFGTTTALGLPALPDGEGSALSAPRFDPEYGLALKPGFAPKDGGTNFDSYTVVYDLYLPKQLGLSSIFQSDLSNRSDGDLWLGFRDGFAVLGTDNQDEGQITVNAWHRVAFTVERIGNGPSFTLTKYVDGAKIGQQIVTGDYEVSANGMLLFADDSGETPLFSLSSVAFVEKALSEAQVTALGGPTVAGPFTKPIEGVNGVQFDFGKGDFAPSFGTGSLTARAPEVTTPVEPVVLKVIAPIKDMLVTPTSDDMVIDLAGVFNGTGLTYKVETAEGRVVNASVADGKLTLDFGGLGHSDLRITATDAEGHSAADVFRVRVAGPNAYTVAVLPDTQDYTDNAQRAPIFGSMTQWLADQQDSRNIQFAIHVGDITQNNRPEQWDVAESALRKLDGKIPYSLLPGNHDLADGGSAANHSSVYLDQRFSPTKQEQVAPGNFGGAYDQESSSARNTYSTFSGTDGTKWLVLSMEFGPRDDVIRWAGDIIEKNLDHRIILVSHALTDYAGRHDPLGLALYDEGAGYDYGIGKDPQGANDGETVYRELSAKYPNIVMTFSGHIFGDGAETNVSYSQYGNPVFEMLVNYQNGISREITGNGDESKGNNGGNGAMRLVTIDPDNKTVSTETYFTVFDDYLDGYRVKPELDRDGLTGSYRGHQETFTGVDLGTPTLYAMAKAGDDLVVAAADGQTKAQVGLDASKSLNPKSEALSYEWHDADGDVVATGVKTNAALGLGKHELTLKVTDAAGVVTTDKVEIVVRGSETLLVETFNDGTADGWAPAQAAAVTKKIVIDTAAKLGIPGLSADDKIAFVPALAKEDKLVLVPPAGVPSLKVGDYALVFDIYVPSATASEYTALVQTDTGNGSDGELFIKKTGATTGAIGISSQYEGTFQFDAWQRLAFVFDLEGSQIKLSKYINGTKVGTQMVDKDRFSIDLSKGALLFSDEDGETSPLYLSNAYATSSISITQALFGSAASSPSLTDEQVKDLGGPSAGGIKPGTSNQFSGGFDFQDGSLSLAGQAFSLDFVPAGGNGSSAQNNFLLKGTVFSRPTAEAGLAAPEAALWEMSDSKNNKLLWTGAGSQDWSDYVVEAGLTSMDNDAIGLVFYYQDDKNHYRFTMNGETNRRELVKVQNGVETTLASTEMGYQFNVELKLKIAVVGNAINVFLGDRNVFDGPVVDAANPLAKGTIGLYSSEQRSSIFDDVVVTRVGLTAEAGVDQRVLDLDGNGKASVTLDGDGSFGRSNITSWRWTDEHGNEIATGKNPVVDLTTGLNKLTLTVTDAAGNASTDRVDVEIVAHNRILVSDSFSSTQSLAKWTVVDEGEMGGIGPEGTSSEWLVGEGVLTQTTDLQSRELTWNGASNADYWKRGWSPLGDGVNVLRTGTYALYNDPKALAWDDYSIEATIKTPDDDGLGFLFHYTDAKNYYKLELDAEGVLDRAPGNGAGSIFNLIRMRAGVEEILGQVPGKYEPGKAFTLRVDIIANKITAFLNGEAIYAYAIEDHGNEKGTFGLYSWGNQGLTFDDVTVVDLTPVVATPILAGTEGDDIISGGAGDEVIRGLDGDDALSGGAGNDRIEGGAGDDTLDGGDGNDRIEGGAGDDVINGGNGADLIFGGEGDDRIDAGAGDDTITLVIAAGAPVIDGGDGSDSLVLSGTGTGTLGAVSSVEHLVVGSGSWSVAESQAFDDIRVKAGAVLASKAVLTGSHRLTVEAGATVAAVTLSGAFDGARLDNAGDITGGIAADATATGTLMLLNSGRIAGGIVTGAGDDSVTLLEGSVVTGAIALGAGHDVFIGSSANETVDGGAGDDVLKGAGGDDTIAGGAGFDTLDLSDATGSVSVNWQAGTASGGGIGSDRFSGIESVRLGSGDDQLRGSAADEVVDGGAGKDTLDAGSGNDRLSGGAGDDALRGGSGDDKLEGGEGNDLLEGGSGNDRLSGGAGDDDLRGGSGDDRIEGGSGNDRLSGGSGHDVFVFEKGFGRDVISDFQASGSSADQLEFATSLLADYAAFTAAATQAGRDVVITLDAETALTLTNVTLASLHADDFRFV